MAFSRRKKLLGTAMAAALLVGCDGPDTVVLVQVKGTVAEPVHQFDVKATVGGETRSLRVPPKPGEPIILPTSFTLQIPRDRAGTLHVAVAALGMDSKEVARGEGMLLSLEPGTQHELTVTLGGNADAGVSDAIVTRDADADEGGADSPITDASMVDLAVDASGAADRDGAVDVSADFGPDVGGADVAADAAADAAPDVIDAAADVAADAAPDVIDAILDSTSDTTFDAPLDAVTAG